MGFVLAPDGTIANAVYSSGPIRRLVPDGVAGMVAYVKSRSSIWDRQNFRVLRAIDQAGKASDGGDLALDGQRIVTPADDRHRMRRRRSLRPHRI